MSQLDSKTFVFSGKFEGHTRSEVEALAREHGASTASSISKKVDYLVAGEKLGNSKRTKANTLGIPIISWEDFQQMINPSSGGEFWTSEISGAEAPKALLERLKELDWSAFIPAQHGGTLRDLLAVQEQQHGVGEAHTWCSEQVRKHLRLLHPYAHDGEIYSHDLSPDGKWLATGNWIGDDYDRGGVMQIWEMKTGRVVNQIRVRGGIGWSNDVNGITWSPTSEHVGLCYDTNGVGAWDPFRDSDEPQVYAYVTDGWDSPPGFDWSGDGKSLFINYFYFKDDVDDGREEEDRGCWIEVENRRGDMSSHASFGYCDERNEPKHAIVDRVEYSVPQVNDESVVFPHMKDKGEGEFLDRNPAEDSPLVHEHVDFGATARFDPVFPIQLGKEEHWGIAFEEGVVVAPKDYPAEKFLNYTLGNQWAWPLTWAPYLRVDTLEELPAKAPLPSYMKTLLKKKKAAASKAKKKPSRGRKRKFPKSEGKTYADIRALTFETLTGLGSSWDYHVAEYLLQLALTDLQQEDPKSAIDAASHIQGTAPGVQNAELAVHCLKRGYVDVAAPLIELAESKIPDTDESRLCPIHAYLASCYHLTGEPDKAAAFEKIALQNIDKDPNDNGPWFLIQYWGLSDQIDKIVEHVTGPWKEKHFSSFELEHAMHYFVWYGDLDSMMEVVNVFKAGEDPLIGEFDFYAFVAKKVIREGAYEKLAELLPQFPTYANNIVETCLEAIAASDIEARDTFAYYLREYPFEGYRREWLSFLSSALVRYPDLALEVLNERDWTLDDVKEWDYYEDGKYRTYFALGKLVSSLGQWESFASEVDGLGDGYFSSFLCGVATTSTDETLREQLISRCRERLSGLSGGYATNLWALLSIASETSENHADILKQAIDVAIAKDKDLAMADLVAILSDNNVLESAHTVWMKMTKANRRHRLLPLLKGFCATKNYNALFDLLMTLDAGDLNNRGQHASRVMNELTSNRGYRL